MSDVSDQVIEAMGFQLNAENVEISASFVNLQTFEFHGIVLSDQDSAVIEGEIDGKQYAAAIGTSLNNLSNLLARDDYVDDEAKWIDEKKCTPPFLMVKFGPSQLHTNVPRHIFTANGEFHTYGAFEAAKYEIRLIATQLLPRVITAIAISVSSEDRSAIRLRAIDQTSFGITDDGNTLHDTRLSISATASTSTLISREILTSSLNRAKQVSGGVDSKMAGFFRLALEETDALKRFLYFFLSIEVHIHRSFKAIDHDKHLGDLNKPADRIAITSTSFFSKGVKSWVSLKDRFIWCSHCVWIGLVQDDVHEFSRLKRVRDSIAHGDIAIPNGGDVAAVEKFAIKLLQQS